MIELCGKDDGSYVDHARAGNRASHERRRLPWVVAGGRRKTPETKLDLGTRDDRAEATHRQDCQP